MGYPYCVELPLSRGYNSIITWLAAQAINDYGIESYLVDERPYVRYYFRLESAAVLFSLRWS